MKYTSILLALLVLSASSVSAETPLNSLFFTSSPKKLKPVSSPCEGIELALEVPDEEKFLDAMEPFLCRPIQEELIQEIKEAVTSFYQARGYPVVGVFVPEGQHFSSGNISLVILVGKLGTIESRGATYFSNEKIAKTIRLKHGDPIRSDKLIGDLNWLNQNPFHTTSLIYQPGKSLGETDIVLVTKDRFPLRVYTGYENTGTVNVGTNRFLAGINWGNAFWLGHELDYMLIFDTPFKEWWAQVASYVIPFPWRHSFRAYGSYTKTQTNTTSSAMSSQGKGWTLGGRYSIPFTTLSLSHEIYFGYEFKRTNNFISFDVNTLFNQYVDISQFLLGYTAKIEYDLGISSLDAVLYMSPGNMTQFNKTSIFNAERPGAKANYIYGELTFNQMFRLPWGCSWILNNIYQLSTAKLLPSEEFIVGGYYTIRGYDEFELIGDDGVILKNEIRSPAFKLPGSSKWKHEIQVLGFVDMGYCVEVDPSVFANNTSFLASIGPGVRYNFNDNLMARLDVGFQLHHIHRLQDNTGHHARVHIGATAAY